MSIYREVLGDKFEQLHPMLQKRFGFSENKPFAASGVMKRVASGKKWLYPIYWAGTKVKLLFPEQGTNIAFSIVNTPQINDHGEEEIYWERTFYFPNKIRYFHARMSLDREKNIVKDYLGEPAVLYSDLAFAVTDDGGLRISSKRQRLVLGKLEIPLPRLLQGQAVVTERYDE